MRGDNLAVPVSLYPVANSPGNTGGDPGGNPMVQSPIPRGGTVTEFPIYFVTGRYASSMNRDTVAEVTGGTSNGSRVTTTRIGPFIASSPGRNTRPFDSSAGPDLQRVVDANRSVVSGITNHITAPWAIYTRPHTVGDGLRGALSITDLGGILTAIRPDGENFIYTRNPPSDNNAYVPPEAYQGLVRNLLVINYFLRAASNIYTHPLLQNALITNEHRLGLRPAPSPENWVETSIMIEPLIGLRNLNSARPNDVGVITPRTLEGILLGSNLGGQNTNAVSARRAIGTLRRDDALNNIWRHEGWSGAWMLGNTFDPPRWNEPASTVSRTAIIGLIAYVGAIPQRAGIGTQTVDFPGHRFLNEGQSVEAGLIGFGMILVPFLNDPSPPPPALTIVKVHEYGTMENGEFVTHHTRHEVVPIMSSDNPNTDYTWFNGGTWRRIRPDAEGNYHLRSRVQPFGRLVRDGNYDFSVTNLVEWWTITDMHEETGFHARRGTPTPEVSFDSNGVYVGTNPTTRTDPLPPNL